MSEIIEGYEPRRHQEEEIFDQCMSQEDQELFSKEQQKKQDDQANSDWLKRYREEWRKEEPGKELEKVVGFEFLGVWYEDEDFKGYLSQEDYERCIKDENFKYAMVCLMSKFGVRRGYVIKDHSKLVDYTKAKKAKKESTKMSEKEIELSKRLEKERKKSFIQFIIIYIGLMIGVIGIIGML